MGYNGLLLLLVVHLRGGSCSFLQNFAPAFPRLPDSSFVAWHRTAFGFLAQIRPEALGSVWKLQVLGPNLLQRTPGRAFHHGRRWPLGAAARSCGRLQDPWPWRLLRPGWPWRLLRPGGRRGRGAHPRLKKLRPDSLKILDLELRRLAASLFEPGVVAQAASMGHDGQQHFGRVTRPSVLLGEGDLVLQVRVVLDDLPKQSLRGLYLKFKVLSTSWSLSISPEALERPLAWTALDLLSVR